MPTFKNAADLKAESLRLYTLCSSTDEAQREMGHDELLKLLERGARKLAGRDSYYPGDYLAQECCANAMLRISEHLAQCRSAESFLAWSMQILRNEYFSLRERESRHNGRTSMSERQPRPQTSFDAPRQDDSDIPREETIGDPSVEMEQEVASRDWIRWVLERIINSQYTSDNSKYVLIKGYLCDLDDYELARDLHTTRKNITVIRARDRANLRQGDPELVTEIARSKV
jgi:DNA-directed RNA polymerase specialized sigma24 family protein